MSNEKLSKLLKYVEEQQHFFQRREKMEEKYGLLSEYVGGQMIEFSQNTPMSTVSPLVDHHQTLWLHVWATRLSCNLERRVRDQTDHLP